MQNPTCNKREGFLFTNTQMRGQGKHSKFLPETALFKIAAFIARETETYSAANDISKFERSGEYLCIPKIGCKIFRGMNEHVHCIHMRIL